MKYIVGFTQYGLDLDVPANSTKDDLINAYLRTLGGPQNAFNYILRYASFVEDTIKDATIIED